MLLSPCPASPGEQRTAVMDLGDAAAQRRALLHLAQHVGQEHHLAVLGAGAEGVIQLATMFHEEARVTEAGLAAHALQIALPTLAVGRVGEHEVELVGGERVRGERGAVPHIVGLDALALEDEVGLAYCVGLGVDLLAVQVDGHFLAALGGELCQRLLGDCQHPASTACAVVDQVGAGSHLRRYGQEDEACHELHYVSRSEVLAGFLVVLLVEAANEFFEDGAHAVVVQAFQSHGAVSVQDGSGTEVDGAV